jgi:enoyl-CoA hydratase
MSEGGDIAIDMAGGVATLKLRNPARRNAVTSAMWRAIHAFASEVGTRDDVRAVVIRGDGDKAFSAGADIADFEIARSGAANARAYDNLVEDSCQLIEAIAQPTVAGIVGPCMGAGARWPRAAIWGSPRTLAFSRCRRRGSVAATTLGGSSDSCACSARARRAY